jgi:hypothetical protein
LGNRSVPGLDAEVFPFPIQWCVLIWAAHPAPGAIRGHVFDRAANKTPDCLENLSQLAHRGLRSAWLAAEIQLTLKVMPDMEPSVI